MHSSTGVTTLLFTDIEGSTRLWEQHPQRMREVLAQHDAICREVVESHGGHLIKTTGDGMLASFADPRHALRAAPAFLQRVSTLVVSADTPIKARCGLHAGVVEQRDGDVFGTAVNRAQRIMSAAHGGQILVSNVVAELAGEPMPDGMQLRDLGDVRLRDVPTAEHLLQLLHPALQQDFPPLRSLASTPNNLPQQLTSFLARERELAELRPLLARSRLLTLHGPGGIGKTRLGLQLAAEALEEFPDGVWLVELAGLTDPALVPQAVASAVGVREEAGRPVLEALLKFFAQRTALVILDNSEHLVQGCAVLAHELLKNAPNVRILASSREPLHIRGEQTYSVYALPTPSAQATRDLEAFRRCAAVRLFHDRAQASQSAFDITRHNADAVGQICRQLEGIPLAIELAAARTRSLSVQQIAERLDDRFALLTNTDPTALPRQHTLRALIDWSVDLLTPDERMTFERLSVFAAGWTLEAAEAVVPGGTVQASAVVGLLGQLVEKSLAVLEPNSGRYRLLDTVQQYARERLAKTGEETRTRDAHLAYYLAFAQAARGHLVGPSQRLWLDRLDVERANLLAAHVWCDHADNAAELGLQLVTATRRYWIVAGLLNIGYRLATEALARRGAQARSLSRCRALFDLGQIGTWMGRYAEAQRHLEESLTIARELGDQRAIAVALQPLAMACHGQGDLETARDYLMSALDMAKQLGDKREIASAMVALAQVHRAQHDLAAAEPLYREAVSIGRELQDEQIVGLSLINVAIVCIARSDVQAARDFLREAATIARQTRMRSIGQSVLDMCAALASATGDPTTAARLFGAAEAQTASTGLHRDPADAAFMEPLIARAREALGEQLFDDQQSAGAALDYETALAETLHWIETCGSAPGDQ